MLNQLSVPVIVVGCLFATAAILANMISFIMIGKINVLLPEPKRISYLWWGIGVRKQFRRLYPGRKLVFMLDASFVLIILCALVLVKIWVFA